MTARNFWRWIAMLSATAAATFLARSFAQDSATASRERTRVKGARGRARSSAHRGDNNGDARRAH